jgi:ribosome-binding protein aMBF1 (putative translation factor)
MSGWTLVGISDESTECEVCGRVELKATMHLVHEDGSELRAGTSCGARKLAVPSAKMRGKVSAFRQHEEVRRCNWSEHARRRFGCSPDVQSVARRRNLTPELARTILVNDWRWYCEQHPIALAV